MALDIHVIPDGPIKVANAESITYCGEPIDADGDVYLCRCGRSANAPFCDGSHRGGFDGARDRAYRRNHRVESGKRS